jgi:hypothetical protein
MKFSKRMFTKYARLKTEVLPLLCSAVILAWALPVVAEETNLVRNGNFEQITNGMAEQWKLTAGGKEDAASFPAEEGKGHVGRVEVVGGSGITYLSQSIRLEPHQKYRLTLLAKLDDGKISFAIGAKGLNRRIVGTTEKSPMVPWFWDEAWIDTLRFVPGQWRTASLEFDSGEVKQVLLSLGGYYSTKGAYSFDDVRLIKISD